MAPGLATVYTFRMTRAFGSAKRTAHFASAVCPVLVGRSAELDAATERWRDARGGGGGLLLLSGEAGIGKTRLLAELDRRVVAQNAPRVLAVSVFARDSDSAGSVLLALAESLQHGDATDNDRADGLRERLLRESPLLSDPARRRRLLAGDLAALVGALLEAEPTLLQLEDLHWADELSLDVLERVGRMLGSTSSLIIATFRSDELSPRTPLRRWRSSMLEQRFASEIRLQRLTEAESTEMMLAVTGNVVSAASALSVRERSDGIPLHIEELLAGSASVRGGAADLSWAPSGSPTANLGPVPETVAEAVLASASRLSAAARVAVEAAAVIGRSFDLDLLALLVDGSPGDLDRALAELLECHVIVAGSHYDSFDFRHALIRDALYDSLAPHRRRALHGRVADAGVAAGSRDSALSAHFERAGRPVEAHAVSLAAAAEASRLSAHREAVELFRRAERTAPSDAGPSARASLAARLAAELAASDENEPAAAQLSLAISLLRGLGDEEGAAELVPRLMAVRHLLGESLESRSALADDALARLATRAGGARDGGSAAVRSRLLAALAAAHMLDRRLDESLEYAERAADLEAGLPAGASTTAERNDIDLTRASVLVFAGRSDEGWKMLERALVSSRRAGYEAETGRAYRMIGSCASVLVEYDRAFRWILEGLHYTAQTERWNDHHYLRAHLSHVYWAVGDTSEAEVEARRALHDGGGGITTRITALISLGYVALSSGDLEAAHEPLDEARRLGERMHELQRLSPPL